MRDEQIIIKAPQVNLNTESDFQKRMESAGEAAQTIQMRDQAGTKAAQPAAAVPGVERMTVTYCPLELVTLDVGESRC